MTLPSLGIDAFCTRFPQVWHVIEAEGLPAAQRHGLLPAAELHRLAGIPAPEANRSDFLRLPLPGGTAVLRFQLMANERLTPTLHGPYAGQPALWRAMIDRHVFFWVTEDRRDGFLRAAARERGRSRSAHSLAPPVVLEFDTRHILQDHGAVAVFSVINSGSTMRGGARARRDADTFRPVAQYRREHAAELAIPGRVSLDTAVILPRA